MEKLLYVLALKEALLGKVTLHEAPKPRRPGREAVTASLGEAVQGFKRQHVQLDI